MSRNVVGAAIRLELGGADAALCRPIAQHGIYHDSAGIVAGPIARVRAQPGLRRGTTHMAGAKAVAPMALRDVCGLIVR